MSELQPTDGGTGGTTEGQEIEFDENDNKIIQLYEVINELIDEQRSRVEDLELLYNDKGAIALQNVEHRNNSVLNQIYADLELKEKGNGDEEEEDDDEEDEDDSEDEQDQGWEIYNSVVSNLNDYMGQVALFTQKLRESQEVLEQYEGPQEQEIKELESVVEAQTLALEETMKRNEELEQSLSSVLNEYSNRITGSNAEIVALHKQISNTNAQHMRQMQDMKQLFERKIAELQQSQDHQYRNEVSQLIDTLSESRTEFQRQIVALTQEMSDAQTGHHREMLKLTEYNQTLTEQLKRKTLLVEQLKRQQQTASASNIRQSLKRTRTALDIDDEDEFSYQKKMSTSSPMRSASPSPYTQTPMQTQTPMSIDSRSQQLSQHNGAKKTRTFTPSKFSADSDRNIDMAMSSNNNGSNTNSGHSSSLQQKYFAQKGGGGSSSKGYKSRSKKRYT